jgi:ligand-binding sensor domain-containing protein/anti-sigma regulatory factor (Ser/Thr protein kinase)
LIRENGDCHKSFIQLKLDNRFLNIVRRIVGLMCIVYGVLINTSGALAQKYTFTHYDIENGLLQSQVNKICQDNSHRLWMGTLGGACRFDGMDYYAISKATGLINNFVYAICSDKQGAVWFGTARGLARLKDQKIQNYPNPKGTKHGMVSHLTQTADGTVWGVMDYHLFKMVNNRITRVKIAGVYDTVTTIVLNKQGKLFVAVHSVGVYSLNNNTWEKYAALPAYYKSIFAVKMVFDKQDPDKLFIQAYKYLLVAQNHTITPYAEELIKMVNRPFLVLEQDAGNNLWIGTNNGAWCLTHDSKLIHFDAHNGFTDGVVSDIYNDKDNNLWLGTQGDGMYRYNGDGYVIYNQSDVVKDKPIVMALGLDNHQNILMGIDGGGVALYNGKTLTSIGLQKGMLNARRVQSLYRDHNGTLWIGTSLGGFWKYDGKNYTVIKGTDHNSVNAITEDADNLLWVATPQGLYSYNEKGEFNAVGVNAFTSSLLALGRDSLLYGTQEGVGLLVNKKVVPNFKLKLLGSSAILCMVKYKNFVLIGTDDQGIYVWNKQTGQVRNYQMKDDLKANSIYSLAIDEYGLIWAGTGRGVSRFAIDERTMNCRILNGDNAKDRIVESNQNAILYYDHKMYVGTTKGLSVYDTALDSASSSAPYIIINGIKLFQQDNSQKVLINAAQFDHIKLPYSQNHLAISFLGVYLKSPESVTYQYRLTGLDDKFCAPVKNDVVDYPSLPPGRYTFEVKAIGNDGQPSKNIARFSFEITPPFYRTYIFQFGVILFLILVGVGLQYIFHERKLQRLRSLEAMKREEKLKIRQQTAEDFHDDLGNKLTRITVLSDILDAKMDPDKVEQKKLVSQIKQNAAALYNGTRDILWAMDPKSDNLYEVLNHIKETGIEIFQDTPVNFAFEGINDDQTAIKLPMEYSRNITVIFKELLNNVLKHADAHHVKVMFSYPDKDLAKLRITDDGTGFDTGTTKRGHGLNNVKARAKRIGGELRSESAKGKGTAIELTFRINKKA